MTVAQAPDMEQAAWPAKEAGPAVSRVLWRMIAEEVREV